MFKPDSQGKPPKTKEDMEVESLKPDKMLQLAADRIDKIFWFGILEDLDRSLELLSYQLGLDKKVNKKQNYKYEKIPYLARNVKE